MGWSGNRVVNGLLKVTVCAYRPWIRDARIIPYGDSKTTATGYSFPTAKLIPWIEANPKNDIAVMCIAIVIAIAVAVFAAFKSYPVDYDDAGKILVDGNILA